MDGSNSDLKALRFGPYVLDPVGRRLLCDGELVKLPPKLFDTLAYLVENAGRVVGKDELMSAVWGGRLVEEGNLSQTVFLLRRAMQEAGGDSHIVTAPGRGHRFAAQVHRGLSYTIEQHGAASAVIEPPSSLLPDQPCADPAEPRSGWRRQSWVIEVMATLSLAVAGLTLVRTSPKPDARFDPPPRSLAILAFANMSSDPSQDELADGLSEELTETLACGENLLVSGRTSAFSFKGTYATIGEIARKLNVRAVLEGAVRRSGERVRVSAQLIDALTGYQYWSRSYDRAQGDLLELESDIAGEVASSLRVTLLNSEAARLEAGGTRDPAAMNAYLRGTALGLLINEDSFRSSIAAFDEAVRLDPGFANAHAGRARSLGLLAAAFMNALAERRRMEHEALIEARLGRRGAATARGRPPGRSKSAGRPACFASAPTNPSRPHRPATE